MFLFLLIFDCVFYAKKQHLVGKCSTFALIATSIGGVTTHTIESQRILLLVSFGIGMIVVSLAFSKIKKPSMLKFFVSVILITATSLGQLQNIDRTFVKEHKIFVDLSVERKYISGRFGLYEYEIETSEYQGSNLMINVSKSVYKSINNGDSVRIEIQEGLLGYHYFTLSDYNS